MVNSPCTCKNCLCTGAATGNASYIASFTSQGVLDPRPHVPLVAALGVNVTVAEAINPGSPNHADFVQANGTSLASPAICGLAALVDQVSPIWCKLTRSTSPTRRACAPRPT